WIQGLFAKSRHHAAKSQGMGRRRAVSGGPPGPPHRHSDRFYAGQRSRHSRPAHDDVSVVTHLRPAGDILRHNTVMRVLLILLACASLTIAQEFRVGTAQVTISPAAGTPMAGYYSTRLSTGVHDDLHAKAIVMASGAEQVALVACDLVGIPPAVIEEAREMIQRNTGIPGANIMISATHSHTGPLIPDGGARAGAYGGDLEIARRYRTELPGKIAESVRLAQA